MALIACVPWDANSTKPTALNCTAYNVYCKVYSAVQGDVKWGPFYSYIVGYCLLLFIKLSKNRLHHIWFQQVLIGLVN